MKSTFPLFLFLLCICKANTLHAQKSNNAVVTIHIDDAEEGDSVRVIQNSFNLRTPETRVPTWLKIHNKEITIKFNAMRHPGYLSLFDRKKKNFMNNEYLVEPGDSVIVTAKENIISYSGRGHKKWQAFREIELSLENIAAHHYRPDSKLSTNENYDFRDSILNNGQRILNKYRKTIGETAFRLMQADLFGSDLIFRVEVAAFDFFPKGDSSQRRSLDSIYRRLNTHMKKTDVLNQQPISAYSYYWTHAKLKKYMVDSFIMLSRVPDLTEQYRFILHNYKGIMRDHLLTSLLHNFNRASDSLVSCLRSALDVVQDPELSAILDKQYLHYLQGTKAFNFSLMDTARRIVRLTDFINKTVVMDFWYTGCLNCIEASTALKSIEPLFRDTNFVFVSICVDPNRSTWMQSLKRWVYSTPDRTNLYTDESGMEHPLIKYYDIFAYPTLMMIDKNGFLSSARLPDPRREKGEPLIKAIRNGLAGK